jgi:hypothetical protein
MIPWIFIRLMTAYELLTYADCDVLFYPVWGIVQQGAFVFLKGSAICRRIETAASVVI